MFKPKTSNAKKFSKPRLYESVDWIEYRNKFIAVNPKCYACGARAVIVDHVVSHKGDEKKFWDAYNYIPLCKEDHDKITGLFDRHVDSRIEQKLSWITAKRVETNTTIVVKVVPIPLKQR
jgi:5-methylcytosine-specific restriction endonuclease McrA